MRKNTKYNTRLFRRLSTVTVIAVYLLILVGSIVRSTGSGMGCPDWPKCFGSWVPPTEVSQLPLSYKEDYAVKRRVKNEKLALMLTNFGFAELSATLLNDQTTQAEADFNPVKTWIEYLNRLLGVLVGFLIFATFISSFAMVKVNSRIFWLSLAALLVVGFTGWIGSIVVSTNLLPGIITFHMFLAILTVLLIIYALFLAWGDEISKVEPVTNRRLISTIILVASFTSLAQVLLGTQVREAVDHVMHSLGYGEKYLWIDNLGLAFYVHRSFSLVVMAIHLYLLYLLKRYVGSKSVLRLTTNILVAIFGIEIITGASMAYFNIPAFLQPIHLFLAILALGIQFFVYLLLNVRFSSENTTIRADLKELTY